MAGKVPVAALVGNGGQSRRPDGAPETSGLPLPTDIDAPARLVRFVPDSDMGH